MIVPPLFYGIEKALPTVTSEPSGSFFFGEPDERGFADDMVFRYEAEQPGVGEVDGIIGAYPIIIFGKIAMLHRLAFYVQGIMLDFSLFVLM